MQLLKSWVLNQQRIGRIRGKYHYLMKRVLRIQRAVRRFLNRKRARVRLARTCNLQRLLKGIYVRMIVRRKLEAILVI